MKSYIDSGTCERYEPYILDEIEFEKKKIVESVANVITVLSKKRPILIMVDNVHMVTKNTLTLITCTNNDSTTQTVYIAEIID